jgi:hypothetical protein
MLPKFTVWFDDADPDEMLAMLSVYSTLDKLKPVLDCQQRFLLEPSSRRWAGQSAPVGWWSANRGLALASARGWNDKRAFVQFWRIKSTTISC